MIKVILIQDQRGLGGPLEFENANTWKVTENGTLAVYRAFGSEPLAEVMARHVLFVEREEAEG